jgi:hypothetical protein
MRRSSEQRPHRKAARSRMMRDLAADWQRWSAAERLTAGLLMGAIWVGVCGFYLTKIFHA